MKKSLFIFIAIIIAVSTLSNNNSDKLIVDNESHGIFIVGVEDMEPAPYFLKLV